MEINVASIQHLSVDPYNSEELGIVSQVSDRQNIPIGITAQKKSISKSQKMNTFGVVLFISLSITVGVLTVCLTSPKSNKTYERVFQNELKSSLISSSQPLSVALGYLNDDHQIDIVVVNSGTDTIRILLSKGNGTFAEQLLYSTGSDSHPVAVAASDFNNDNRMDIAVANYGTNNILLFYEHRDGTFENSTSYRLGYNYNPDSITVTDLNQDNWLDIVIACYDTDPVETLINTCL